MFKEMIHSFAKNRTGIILILTAALSTAVGQMLWKLSQHFPDAFLIIGFLLYFCGAVLMIVAFRFGDLSVLHPLLSVGYIFSIVLGGLFLGEKLSIVQIAGILIILAGASLIGGGDNG
ncbi:MULTISPECIES: EamA family transporter [unclassified Sporolactobacillus]|uniref:EamA family transporter n=1 Tax=unclassified Sporolactobacillus TaxID=2628533 RepID=UPI0023682858|nr:EamA family transporter [Sporolactobacillus sp. CQH2019]MDD9147231.1 EamA family transporter [Sporolactobacillus sp. CQH2019]